MSVKSLESLAGESLQVDPDTGAITPSEILRLREEYGIDVRGDYNFLREGVIRLKGGGAIARQDPPQHASENAARGPGGGRVVLGLAGHKGSGKDTLAALLAPVGWPSPSP
jgi:hypothetical protein